MNMGFRFFSTRQGMLTAVGIGMLMRLTLSLTTWGTVDVLSWERFLNAILTDGWLGIYAKVGDYNHPPLMSLMLLGIHQLLPFSPNGFAFLLRLPAILSDAGTLWVLHQLISRYWNVTKARYVVSLVALSPVLILVSGFHGNTDPVFMFLVLLAARQLLFSKAHFQVGLILGLATSIKLVPVVVMPLFFFGSFSLNSKTKLTLGFLTTVALGWAYPVWTHFDSINPNVFQYSSRPGIWGLSQLLSPISLWSPTLTSISKLLLFLVISASSAWIIFFSLGRDKEEFPRRFLFGLGVVFLQFMVITPGFGVQYLAWLAPTIVFFGLRYSVIFNLLGGIFLFSVYNNWADGLPWHIAYPVLWNPWEWFLALVLWLVLVKWLARLFKTEFNRVS